MTTFVANFLGQSNLLTGTIAKRADGGDVVVVEIRGRRLSLPADRVHADGSAVHVGVRPEKIQISLAADAVAVPGHNELTGVVTDSSFTGVSTQYQVRMPWGQEVVVFEQNMRRDLRIVAGESVVLHWDPAHTFALDATQAADAGAGIDDDAAVPDPVVV
jgi:spermidine/putrescine transport system ATP-binding protein